MIFLFRNFDLLIRIISLIFFKGINIKSLKQRSNGKYCYFFYMLTISLNILNKYLYKLVNKHFQKVFSSVIISKRIRSISFRLRKLKS